MIPRFTVAVVRRRKAVLMGALLLLSAAFVWGGQVATKLNTGGGSDPHAQSSIATDVLDKQFHAGPANVVLLVTARRGHVDSPDVTAAGTALTQRLSRFPHVAGAFSYWSLGSPPPLRSTDDRQALVLGRLVGSDDQVSKWIGKVDNAFAAHGPVIDVSVTGQATTVHQIGTTIQQDLARAESMAVPITLVLLVVVFGSLVAATLPLALGAVSVVGTFATLRILVSFTHVSIFALNLTTALGLGLAIDYSLFVVNRFREELKAGNDPHDAVVRTMDTAGRAVMVSALTVAASLSALLVFPLYFLRSFAYAGIAVALITVLATLVILPALLAVLGSQVDRLDLRRAVLRLVGRELRPKGVDEGFWHRVAMAVMRRPVWIAGIVIVVLLLLGSPFLGVHFGQPDDRVLPRSATSRQAFDQIRHDFTSNESNAFSVVAPWVGNPAGQLGRIGSYAAQLSAIKGVARVDALTGSYAQGMKVAPANPSTTRFANPTGTWLSVVPTANIEAESPAGEALTEALRHSPSPWKTEVTGFSAPLVDTKHTLFRLIPLALTIIAVITFVTLFLMFGSLLVPAKAIVLNILSLTATFGAMVWVFQKGHGASLLDFTATGTLDTSMPILMFCVAFGISMDYEVFLLSRIKEEHDRGADNVSAVAVGLERTGRIVTAAAALLAVVFISLATSHVAFIKLFGVGLMTAVLVDATLIRGTLVPAFMRLAGNANWWAPGPLRRLHDRYGLSESPSVFDESHPNDQIITPIPRVARNRQGAHFRGAGPGGSDRRMRRSPRRLLGRAMPVVAALVVTVLLGVSVMAHGASGRGKLHASSARLSPIGRSVAGSQSGGPVASTGSAARGGPVTGHTSATAQRAVLPDGQPQPVLIVYDGETITLAGAVPSDVAERRLSALAESYSRIPNAKIVNRMIIDPRVPDSVGVRVIEINAARFATGSGEVTSIYAPELSRVVAVMKAMSNLTVLAIGHADQRGDSAQNLRLSQARASAVVGYLVTQGISPDRLSARGVGDRDPLTQQSDDAGLALNRRTEFVFYGLLVGT